MKRILLILSFILISFIVKAQDSIPESYVHLSVGIGQPHGIFGIKTFIGVNNTGIIIGLGQFEEMPAYNFGFQLGIKSVYFNLNYGVIGAQQINNRSVVLIKAPSILAGGMIGLGKKKLIFVDLAFGHSFGAPETVIGREVYNNNTVIFNLGLGYRIPGGN